MRDNPDLSSSARFQYLIAPTMSRFLSTYVAPSNSKASILSTFETSSLKFSKNIISSNNHKVFPLFCHFHPHLSASMKIIARRNNLLLNLYFKYDQSTKHFKVYENLQGYTKIFSTKKIKR